MAELSPQTTATVDAPVAIVGRGPVGMTLALLLARAGVRTVVVDRAGADIPLMSKAVLMHGSSAEILGRAGIGEALLARGVALTGSRTFYGERELFYASVPPPVPGGYPRLLNFPQSETEALLLARVRVQPLIDLRLGSEFVALRQTDAGVVSSFSGPEGRFDVRSRYLAGCDGSRSAVRKQLAIVFAGHTHNDHYLIVDIRARLPYANERRFAFDPPSNRGRTVLIHPQHDNLWHLDIQVGAPPDLTAEQRSGKLDARIRAVIGDEINYEIASMTTYVFKQLIADRFSHGRAFLVGDAAHLYAPYGARGLNSGLADADNLAWKLACVLHDEAPAALLDSYDVERRSAAAQHFRVTAETAHFMAPTTRRGKLRRDVTLAAAQRVAFLKRFVNSGHFYEPLGYPTSPITTPEAGSSSVRALVGEVLPEIALGDPTNADEPRRLRALAGGSFLVLHLTSTVEQAKAVRAAIDAIGLPRCARLVAITESGTHATSRDGLLIVSATVFSALQARLAPGGLADGGRILIVRPDLHVASCHDLVRPDHASGAPEWVSRALGRAGAATDGVAQATALASPTSRSD